MSNEEIQKKMEFIVQQQAQFTVNIQKLEENHARAEGRLGKLESAFVGLFNLVNETALAQKRTDETVSKLADRVNDLAKSTAATDERLNSLILVVEKYISSKQNGGHPGQD